MNKDNITVWNQFQLDRKSIVSIEYIKRKQRIVIYNKENVMSCNVIMAHYIIAIRSNGNRTEWSTI